MNNDTDRINWLEKRERFLMQDYEFGEWGIGQYEGNVNDRVFITLIKVELFPMTMNAYEKFKFQIVEK